MVRLRELDAPYKTTGLQISSRQVPPGGRIDDPNRTALADKLLHEPPGLPGMHVEFAGLVHAIQDLIGQAADVVGWGMARRPAVSRPRRG